MTSDQQIRAWALLILSVKEERSTTDLIINHQQSLDKIIEYIKKDKS